MKIVVSGAIGAGKSTVVRAALKQLGWAAPGGFFTHWGGVERGAPRLYIETWSGAVQPMAHRRAEAPGGECPPYELDLARFNPVAIGSLSIPGRPIVIDELGLIELGSADFTKALAEAFRGPAPVLAVIQQRALASWLRLIGSENVRHQLLVESATRAALPAQIATLFRT